MSNFCPRWPDEVNPIIILELARKLPNTATQNMLTYCLLTLAGDHQTFFSLKNRRNLTLFFLLKEKKEENRRNPVNVC